MDKGVSLGLDGESYFSWGSRRSTKPPRECRGWGGTFAWHVPGSQSPPVFLALTMALALQCWAPAPLWASRAGVTKLPMGF